MISAQKAIVDVLVHFDPETRRTLLDVARMEDELSRMLGLQVALIERVAINKASTTSVARPSSNPSRRSMRHNNAYLLDVLLAARMFPRLIALLEPRVPPEET